MNAMMRMEAGTKQLHFCLTASTPHRLDSIQIGCRFFPHLSFSILSSIISATLIYINRRSGQVFNLGYLFLPCRCCDTTCTCTFSSVRQGNEKCLEGREWAIRYDRCVGMITIVPIWLPFCRYDLRLPVWLPLYRNCHRCAGMATVVPEYTVRPQP